jgi:hypothetical protein
LIGLAVMLFVEVINAALNIVCLRLLLAEAAEAGEKAHSEAA